MNLEGRLKYIDNKIIDILQGRLEFKNTMLILNYLNVKRDRIERLFFRVKKIEENNDDNYKE